MKKCRHRFTNGWVRYDSDIHYIIAIVRCCTLCGLYQEGLYLNDKDKTFVPFNYKQNSVGEGYQKKAEETMRKLLFGEDPEIKLTYLDKDGIKKKGEITLEDIKTFRLKNGFK